VTAPLPCPARLRAAFDAHLIEDATATVRHDARNRLAAIRNGAFYVRRKLQTHPAVLETDARIARFLDAIDGDADALGLALGSQLPAPAPAQRVSLDGAVKALLADVAWPTTAPTWDSGPASGAFVRADEVELGVAILCVLQVATAGTTAVTLRGHATATQAGVSVALPPGEATGRAHGMARRIAGRWGGALQDAAGQLTLLLPRAGDAP